MLRAAPPATSTVPLCTMMKFDVEEIMFGAARRNTLDVCLARQSTTGSLRVTDSAARPRAIDKEFVTLAALLISSIADQVIPLSFWRCPLTFSS